MTREYEIQIRRSEEELKNSKAVDAEVLSKLRLSWDVQRQKLERDLHLAEATIKVLKEERENLIQERRRDELKMASLQNEIDSLRGRISSVATATASTGVVTPFGDLNHGGGTYSRSLNRYK